MGTTDVTYVGFFPYSERNFGFRLRVKWKFRKFAARIRKRAMAKENTRIKDSAERAGVSVGTVDRVLHNRPNVSKKAMEKVKKALEEMDYRPNMYASALAYNKTYTFYCLLPKRQAPLPWLLLFPTPGVYFASLCRFCCGWSLRGGRWVLCLH